MLRISLAFCPVLLGLFGVFAHRADADEKNFDVVIVGATPAGIAAGINASDAGADVLLVDRHHRIGGLVTSGMSNTDFKTMESLGGTWKRFTDRVLQHYTLKDGPGSQEVAECFHGTFYEPKVALEIFEEMLAVSDVEVWTRHSLGDVTVVPDGPRRRLTAIQLHTNESDEPIEVTAAVFVDATYEGDLMDAAGVPHTVGAESHDVYDELHAPAQGNDHVMAYNFRVIVTNDPANQIPFHRPDGYDPDAYPKLLAAIRRGEITELNQIVQLLKLPNQKANVNDRHNSDVESFMLYQESDEWPEASAERRAELWALAKFRAQSMLYFLSHDPRLPEKIRSEMAQWGYARDEFADSEHFPPWLYVREGFRMLGVRTITEQDTQAQPGSVRAPAAPDSVAIADYWLSSHGSHLGPDGETRGRLGLFAVPYQIPYGVMLPEQIDGLIVPVAVSASRLAFASIRMEPTWTALGQAAGLAAAQAIEADVELRDVDVAALQRSLHRRGGLTFYTSDVFPDSPYFHAVQFFGNHGMFQTLLPADHPNKHGDWRHGQHFEAFEGHAIKPHEKMTQSLAEQWAAHADQIVKQSTGRPLDSAALLQRANELSRGQFLRRLYQLFAMATGEASEDEIPEDEASNTVASKTEKEQPNLLFVLADDVGIETLGCYGGSSYDTRNLDQMAASGVRFTHAFATPLCTPSRVQLLTGQYPFRTGWTHLIHRRAPEERLVSPELPMLARSLQQAGYRTAVSGKWQLGHLDAHPDHPHHLGFDEYCLWDWRDSQTFKLHSCYGDPVIRRNGDILQNTENRFGPDVHAEFIEEFIARPHKEPWFVFHPMILAHFPMVPTPDHWPGETPPEAAVGWPPGQGDSKYYPQMIRYMDQIVGQLITTLRETGQLHNTVVVFCGDNGSYNGMPSSYRGRTVVGGKRDNTDAGTRVPMIVFAPERVEAGIVSDRMVDLADLAPTLLDFANAPASHASDGVSLKRSLRSNGFDQELAEDETYAFTQIGSSKRLWNHRLAVDEQGRCFDVTRPFEEQPVEPTAESETMRLRLQKLLETH